MKRTVILSALLVALLPAVAWAGADSPQPVVLNLKQGWAKGSLGSARNSHNHVAFLGYSLDIYPARGGAATATSRVSFFAGDAAGTIAGCVIDNPDPVLLTTLGTISDDSYLKFHWNPEDEGRVCTIIYVVNASTHEPKR